MAEERELTTNERIAAVMGEIRALKQTARNEHFRYSFTPMAEITDHVRPLLAKHGVTVLTREVESEVKSGTLRLVAEFALAGPDDTENSVVWERRTMTHAVRNVQGVAAAWTFALRYWLCARLLISTTDEEIDGGEQERRPHRPDTKPVVGTGTAIEPDGSPRDREREKKLERIEDGAEKLGWDREKLREVSVSFNNDLDAILTHMANVWKDRQARRYGAADGQEGEQAPAPKPQADDKANLKKAQEALDWTDQEVADCIEAAGGNTAEALKAMRRAWAAKKNKEGDGS